MGSMAEFENQALSPSVERYTLDGSEDNVKFAFGSSVVVTIENAESKREFDSPRIHTKFITEFKGDSRVRAHYDPLLTVHKNYIACLVHLEQSGDVVRVIDRVSRQRQFVKTFLSTPVSLLFSPTTPHLAVLDQLNNLYVFTVGTDCNVEQFVTVTNWPIEEDDEEKPILAWCPYIPDDSSDDDDSCLLVAIAKGKKVYLVNLDVIQRNGHHDPIDFSKVTEDPDAVLTIELEQKVVTMTISPDATAMAISTENGIVTFYTLGISQEEIKLAQHWNPLLKSSISDVFFLDDVADSNTMKTFWKHCLVVGENGHRLALYDCLTWKSIGSLRFDCSLDLSSFHVCIDPKVRYVHLSEKDGGNMFCVELENEGVPRFLSITQLTFSRPLSAICPYNVTDQQENAFEDINDGDNDSIEKLFIHYIAVSQRGIAELEVQMDKTENNVHSNNSEAGDGNGSVHGSDIFEDIPTVDTVQLHLPSTSELMNVEASGSARSWMDRDDIETRFNELHSKLEQMSTKLVQSEAERNASYTNEQILQLLHQFKDEFALREDRLLANVSDLVETSRIETLNAVRNVLNENAIAMENNLQANQRHTVEYVSQKVSEKVVESFAAVVLPSVDRMCGQLFKQMNETFRQGLEQYMTQFRAFHQAALNAGVAATPVKSASVSADRQQLSVMIKNKQLALAFETVLNQGDLTLLDFVCNGIDPDEFFGSNTLPEAILLPLLQQLSLRLDVDTDHKFRYLEHILVKLRPEDMDSNIVQNIMHGLNKSLMDIHNMAADPTVKRSARMLITLTKNYLRN